MELIKGTSLMFALPLLANRLGWKGLQGDNTLAYLKHAYFGISSEIQN